MNKREKMLAAAVAALAVLWACSYYFGLYSTTLRRRQADRDAAQAKLEVAEQKVRLGREAVKQMEAWDKRSLPADKYKAQSLYKAWLAGKAKDAGLAVKDITTLTPTATNSNAFKAIKYNLVASGSLSSVTGMLYEFYRSPQLHQITRLQLIHPPGASQLTVSMDVEALSLRGAAAKDKLPEGDSKRLKLASLDDYKKTLSDRNLVSAYSPPRPPEPVHEHHEPPPKPKFDESEFARFSAAVNSGKGMQAWIYVLPTGETLRVMAGDPVKIGALDGKIESVEERSLVFKTGDKRFRVHLGDFLRKGTEIDAHGAATENKQAAPPQS